MLKHCNKCGADKERSAFYARGAVCKVCTRAMVRANRRANAEYYRIADTLRRPQKRKPADKAANSARQARWYAANKLKRRAHNKVHRALASGILVRPAHCSGCGQPHEHLEAHHADYSKPLEVLWLCDPCHSNAHKRVRVPEGFRRRKSRWFSRPEATP